MPESRPRNECSIMNLLHCIIFKIHSELNRLNFGKIRRTFQSFWISKSVEIWFALGKNFDFLLNTELYQECPDLKDKDAVDPKFFKN
jgi:hypothetical protein